MRSFLEGNYKLTLLKVDTCVTEDGDKEGRHPKYVSTHLSGGGRIERVPLRGRSKAGGVRLQQIVRRRGLQ